MADKEESVCGSVSSSDFQLGKCCYQRESDLGLAQAKQDIEDGLQDWDASKDPNAAVSVCALASVPAAAAAQAGSSLSYLSHCTA